MKYFFWVNIIVLIFLFSGCADAGKDKKVLAGELVTLTAKGSTPDVGGKIEEYNWKQISGPKVELSSYIEEEVTFIAPNSDSEIKFILNTIEKGGYISNFNSSDSINITVKQNIAPVAIIEVSSNIVKVNSNVTFDASKSTDIDSNIIKYSWIDSKGKELSSNKKFVHSFNKAGVYTLILKVTDDWGMSSTSSVNIEVKELELPKSIINVNKVTSTINEELTFSAKQSYDSDGKILKYKWFDSSNNILSEEKEFKYTFKNFGEHLIFLTVTDDDNLTNTSEVVIKIEKQITKLELNLDSTNIEVDNSFNPTILALYNDGSSQNINTKIEWIIEDMSIVMLEQNNILKATAVGTTSIKAKIGKLETNSIIINVVDKPDLLPPVITLNGEESISIIQGEKYIELGATATDNKDENVIVNISGSIDNLKIGTYEIIYTAKDKAGNLAVKTRTIEVMENIEYTTIDYDFPVLKNDLIHVQVNSFGEGSFHSNMGTIDYDSNRNTENNIVAQYFTKSDDILIIKAIPKSNSIIKTWLGCDSVSSDKSECSVSLEHSHIITPIFEYKEVITVDNLFDLSKVKEITVDWTEQTPFEAIGTTIIILDDTNLALTKEIEKIKEGDYINFSGEKLNFLRKVKSIEKESTYKYKIISTNAYLTDVINQGTIFFESGYVSYKKPSESSSMSKLSNRTNNSYNDNYGDESTVSITGDEYYAVGKAKTYFEYSFGLDIKDYKVKNFAVDVKGGSLIKLNALLNPTITSEKELFKNSKKSPICARVGVIKICPNLAYEGKLKIKAEAKLENLGATAEASIEGKFNIGYTYSKEKSESYQLGSGNTTQKAFIAKEGNAKISVPLSLGINLKGYFLTFEKIDAFSEIGLSFDPYVSLKAKCTECVGRRVGDFGVDFDVYGKVGVELDIKFKEIKAEAEVSKNLYTKSIELFNDELENCEKKKDSFSGVPANGLFTGTISWQNPAVKLSMQNSLMEYQGKSCESYSIGSGDLTLYDVYPSLYPVIVTVEDKEFLSEKDYPDEVRISIGTPGEGKVLKTKINTEKDYSLGHVADIHIWRVPNKPPQVVLIPLGSSPYKESPWKIPTGGWISAEKTNVERKICQPALSCGCLPCKYEVIPYLQQVLLGPISGGTYRIYKATEYGKTNPDYLFEGVTSIGNDIDTTGIMNIPVILDGETPDTLEEATFMQKIAGYQGDFIIEVFGGVDIDVNDDWKVDENYTPLNGVVHSIVSRESLLKKDYKVNVLTELSFQVSKDLLGASYDKQLLDSRLDDIARHVLIEKLHYDSVEPLNRKDLLYWLPNANKNWLIKDYEKDLFPIVMKIHNGENIYDDAYDFIYGDSVNIGVPTLSATWYYLDENIVGNYFIGKMNTINTGLSDITSYSLEGEGSNKFYINQMGDIFLKEGESLDYEEDNYYDLFVTATNSEGTSRPILLRLIINDKLDAPSFKEFTSVDLLETANVGEYVGKVTFEENMSTITSYQIAGSDKDDFTIDENGNIYVGDNADLDYENNLNKTILVTATNSYGTSIPKQININILDVVDVPSIDSKEIYLNEDILSGSLIANLDIRSNTEIEDITILGEDKDTFTIGLDGKLYLSSDAKLDYENKKHYFINIVALNNLGVSRPALIHIIVKDMRDIPVLNATKLFTKYNVMDNTIIGKINIKDEGLTSIESFNLEGKGSENFEIDKFGNVKVKAENSLENYQFKTITMVVSATNLNGSSKTNYLTVEVGSDVPHIVSLNTYVDENSYERLILGSVMNEIPSTPIISTRLVGNGSENFMLDKNGKLHLLPTASIDFEQQTEYNLTAYMSNSFGESKGKHIYIKVYDMPDTIVIKSLSTSLYEDSLAGKLIGFINIISLGNHTLDHFELKGEGSENFIVEKDARLLVSNNATFDSNLKSKYRLTIEAVDTDGVKSNKAYIDINVVKTINTIPFIENSTISVSEDTEVSTIIGNLEIISKSKAVEQVWIEGIGSEYFNIDNKGVIRLEYSIDYEKNKVFNLKVFARNVFGISIASELKIEILNVIDDEPQLENTTINVDENTKVGNIIGKMKVINIGNNPITEFILNGVDNDTFTIDTDGNIILAKNIDYEFKQDYKLTVFARNSVADSLTVTLNVNVQNIEEHVPVLESFKGFVENGALPNTLIGVINKIYIGDGTILEYIVTGDGKDNFRVDLDGSIYVSNTATLDENIKKVFNLNISLLNTVGSSEVVTLDIVVTSDKSVPITPTNLISVKDTPTSVDIEWNDASNNERGFNLYKNNYKIAVIDKNITTYTIDSLDENTNYVFKLTAFNDLGESSPVLLEVTTLSDSIKSFQRMLQNKCGISKVIINNLFNPMTKIYDGSIDCSNKSLINSDLDSFKILNKITGSLNLSKNQLTNIDALNSLSSVGTLDISKNQLTNLNGLNSLTDVSDSLYLYDNKLTNVDGLSSLRNIGGSLNLSRNILEDINGLNSLLSVESINLSKNKIANVDALSSLTNISGSLYLNDNVLENINGLISLSTIGGSLDLSRNNLRNVDGLSSLKSIGNSLQLSENQLTDIDGLSSLMRVDNSIYLYANTLENINGLNPLIYIGDSLYLYGNNIINLDNYVFENLKGNLILNYKELLAVIEKDNNLLNNSNFLFSQKNITIHGEKGDDTYIYNKSDKTIIIDDSFYNNNIEEQAGNDILLLAGGINQSDIILEEYDENLIIKINYDEMVDNELQDYVVIKNWRSVNNGIEKIIFTNGEVLEIDKSIIYEYATFTGNIEASKHHLYGFEDNLFNGTDNAETIYSGAGNDTINSGDGNDILDGGTGDDQLNGWRGDDIYVFARGYGHDSILDYYNYYGDIRDGGNDTIQFKGNITADDLIFMQNNSDLIIGIKEDGIDFQNLSDKITISNWLDVEYCIENFIFEDGTSLTKEDVQSLITAPNDDVIH